jgi:hypothetical protein
MRTSTGTFLLQTPFIPRRPATATTATPLQPMQLQYCYNMLVQPGCLQIPVEEVPSVQKFTLSRLLENCTCTCAGNSSYNPQSYNKTCYCYSFDPTRVILSANPGGRGAQCATEPQLMQQNPN